MRFLVVYREISHSGLGNFFCIHTRIKKTAQGEGPGPLFCEKTLNLVKYISKHEKYFHGSKEVCYMRQYHEY